MSRSVRVVILSDGETWETLQDGEWPLVLELSSEEYARLVAGEHPRHIQSIRDKAFQGPAEET